MAAAGSVRLGAAYGPGGCKMRIGLVWRTILFFGLTAGYTVLAALPYLA